MAMMRTFCLTSAFMVSGFAAQAVPVEYNFTTDITSVRTFVGISDTVPTPNSPLLTNGTGTAVLNIDTDNIIGGSYFAGTEFSMTLDLGDGPEDFDGSQDAFGAAFFLFDDQNNITFVDFSVADDDTDTLMIEEDIIRGDRVVDFSVSHCNPPSALFCDPVSYPSGPADDVSNPLFVEVQQAPVIPLPGAIWLLLSGAGGLALVRRKQRV